MPMINGENKVCFGLDLKTQKTKRVSNRIQGLVLCLPRRTKLVLVWPLIFLFDVLMVGSSYKNWKWLRRESKTIWLDKWRRAENRGIGGNQSTQPDGIKEDER